VKRSPFLAAAGSLLLAGCGGRQILSALPGVARTSTTGAPAGKLRLVPAAADTIPATQIANPIIGEAARFDGNVAPGGWVIARGQTIAIADNPHLFSILRTVAGGDGKVNFKLPDPPFGMLIAVAGMFPSSPTVLASSVRFRTVQGLPAGARPALPRRLTGKRLAAQQARDAALRETQALVASAIRPAERGLQLPSPEAQAAADRTNASARDAVLASLSPVNRNSVLSFVDAILGSRVSVNAATQQLGASLGAGEARAVLDIYDGAQRQLRSGWTGMDHPDVQGDAARYALDIAFTPAQLQQLRAKSGAE